MARQNIRRRRYPIVNRSHQYRFLSMIILYNLIIVSFFAVTLLMPDIVKLQDPTFSLAERGVAADRILYLHARVWPAIIALMCLLGLHSFRVFHRFIGPLYRFVLSFEKLSKGELNFRVKLRKRDFLVEEEKAFNDMIESLAETVGRIQASGRKALVSMDNLERELESSGDGAKIDREVIAVHRLKLERLISEADYFSLEEASKTPGEPAPHGAEGR